MRQITFDIETQNVFQEVGSNNPADLDLSVIVIHDSQTNIFSGYSIHNLETLWTVLDDADMLITFNGDHFDIPLLNKYYPGDLSKIKSIDLLREIKKSLGKRIKLDDVAHATLGTKKSAHGLEAVAWWKQGDIKKILTYCEDDVRITRQLFDHALSHGTLKYTNYAQNTIDDIVIDTSQWNTHEPQQITQTPLF